MGDVRFGAVGSVVSSPVSVEIITCGSCGIVFGLSCEFIGARRFDRNLFYCPGGCHIKFCDSELVKLKRERERLEALVAAKQRSIDHEREAADRARARAETALRSARSYKGHLKRVRNRVAKGVCPCCNRFFVKLHRHMQSEHPDYCVEKTEEKEGGDLC